MDKRELLERAWQYAQEAMSIAVLENNLTILESDLAVSYLLGKVDVLSELARDNRPYWYTRAALSLVEKDHVDIGVILLGMR